MDNLPWALTQHLLQKVSPRGLASAVLAPVHFVCLFACLFDVFWSDYKLHFLFLWRIIQRLLWGPRRENQKHSGKPKLSLWVGLGYLLNLVTI